MVGVMSGGVAVSANLLCVAWSGAHGRVFLFDLDERRPLSYWSLLAPGGKWSDAGGVAIDRDFTIYVADAANDRVRRYSAFGVEKDPLGLPVEREPGAARRDRGGVLDHPHAVAVFGDSIFVVCGERKLRRGVQCFDRRGRPGVRFASFGDPHERFGAPRGIWAGREGVFVADTLHGVIQRFRLHGPSIGHFSTAEAPDERSRPAAVVVTAQRWLLVLDQGDRPGLRGYELGGERRELPAALVEVVEDPVALARDDAGRTYVLDQHGERVLRLDPEFEAAETLVHLAEMLDDPGLE